MNLFRKPLWRDLFFWLWVWIMVVAISSAAHLLSVQGIQASSEFDAGIQVAIGFVLGTLPARFRNAYVRRRDEREGPGSL
jgi:hypothetical protein